MSTIYVFDQELPAATTGLQPTDQVLVHRAATGTKERMTGSLLGSGSPAIVNTTATLLSLTQAAHANRTVTNNSAAITITLPAATGTGDTYTIYQQTAATATSSVYAAAGTDVLQGVAWVSTTSTDNAEAFATSATSDKVSVNGTTTGGIVGDKWVFVDVASGKWNVQGYISQTGATATPFSAT
jgi:hypothetical protein